MNEFTPLISIIIPVYNGKNYLKEAIDSALSQSYTNIEIIVVNDGSNDNRKTEQIILSYGDSIKYFSKENGGVASALNLGIEKMSGQYFSWLSHDDMYYPNKLEYQIEYLRNTEDKNIILYSDYDVIDAQSVVQTTRVLNHGFLIHKPLYALLRGGIHGCSLLIPKIAFEKCGLFDTSLRYTQDYALWFTMYRHFSFIHIPEVLIQSRTHIDQDSNKHFEAKPEGEKLWIGFLDNLADDQILSCEDQKELFFLKMSLFLEKTPYINASKYARRKAYKVAQPHRFVFLGLHSMKYKLKSYIKYIKGYVKR